MVLLVVRPSLRNSRPMRSALIVLGTTVIPFAFAAFAASEQPPFVCVRPLGGTSPAARPQQKLEYAYWIAVVVHEQLALTFLAKRPTAEGVISGCVLNVLFAAGSAASFTESLVPWATLLCIASISHLNATAYLTRTFRAAYINATDSSTRRLTAVFGSVAFALWNTYPLVWLAAQYSAITPETEACVWLILDITTKISVSFIMVFGSYREDTRAADAALQVLDAQRKSAEARDSAKRVFMRWVIVGALCGSQRAILCKLHFTLSHAGTSSTSCASHCREASLRSRRSNTDFRRGSSSSALTSHPKRSHHARRFRVRHMLPCPRSPRRLIRQLPECWR